MPTTSCCSDLGPVRVAPIACDITATQRSTATDLGRIARACAEDLGQPVRVSTHVSLRGSQDSAVTLHLPAQLATEQHEVWCLACRLACFLPRTRVSVLVHGEQSFTAAAAERALSA